MDGARPKFVPACLRTGMCCTNLTMTHSPKQMREAYRAWRDNKPDIVRLQDIDIIYPMLAGRCRGKAKYPDGDVRYIYGPCKHLIHETSGTGDLARVVAGCSIHDDKPRMCKGYPGYDKAQEVRMNADTVGSNPANDQGCGYNVDPLHGKPREFYSDANLIPLSDDEK